MLEELINDVKGCTNVCLTPNTREFKKLYESVLKHPVNEKEDLLVFVNRLSQELEDVAILCKGQNDLLSVGKNCKISF